MHQSEQDEKQLLQPRERFELSTPGLQDQCSDHWANEADTLVFKIDKTNKQRRKQKRTVNKNFDFCAPQSQNVAKRDASGKKGKVSCSKYLFDQIKANLADI